MKNIKKLVLILAFCVIGIQGRPQIIGKLISEDKQLLKEAIENAVVVVERSYILLDTLTNTKYGRGGRNYFGRSYFVGVFSDSALWVNKQMAKPWLNDPGFTPLALDSNHIPVATTIRYRGINQGTFKGFNFGSADTLIDASLLEKMKNTPLLVSKDSIPASIHYTDSLNTDKQWLFLIHTQTPLNQDPAQPIKVLIFRPQAKKFSPDSSRFAFDRPSINGQFIEGALFNYKANDGIIKLSFAGFAQKLTLDWYAFKNQPLKLADTNLVETTVKLLHQEGFALSHVGDLCVAGNELKTLKTNENGEAIFMLPKNQKHKIILNEKIAGCVKAGDSLTVSCQFKNNEFIPKTIVSGNQNCNE